MSDDEFVRCVRKCEEECELREGAPCALPCDICITTKTMVGKDILYWLKRLEDAIDELEATHDDKDWDRILGLIDELRRIHKNIEAIIMMHGCF